MEQTITIDIPGTWTTDIPNDSGILRHVFRLGMYQYQRERALQLYQDGVGSLGYIAEQVRLPKHDLIREFRLRGIEPDFSEETLREEFGQ